MTSISPSGLYLRGLKVAHKSGRGRHSVAQITQKSRLCCCGFSVREALAKKGDTNR